MSKYLSFYVIKQMTTKTFNFVAGHRQR